ncbi:hypothetical protein [Rickettsia endosymbiont of Ceutorhynchus obstrictus]|uniref:hypothetical protein n=1 Tax=Rickettsia endosymbiont of Ceutorhynchus obstrictus TaxID=3066249 RepID=UPI0031333C96
MAKSDSNRYLDDNKTDLYTANNLYKYALKGFENTNILKEQQGLTKLAIDGYKIVKWRLTEALLFGKAEAAAALAYMNREGLGIEKNLYQDKLFVSIGNKLGDATCRDLITKRDYSNVEKEANIWVNFIKSNKRNPDAEIPTADLVYAEGVLKDMLLNNSIKLDAYNSHIDIIKLDQAETTHAPNIPHPQTTTAYHQPYARENDPHHSPVKPMGQNADKHSHCDIL